MASRVLIHGLGLADYRSFDDEMQYLGPFRTINLFIGQNNSGKSNVLRFLTDHYTRAIDSLVGTSAFELAQLDRRVPPGRSEFFRMALELSEFGMPFDRLDDDPRGVHYVRAVRSILGWPQFSKDGQGFWLELIARGKNRSLAWDPEFMKLVENHAGQVGNALSEVWKEDVRPKTGVSHTGPTWIQDVLLALVEKLPRPEVVLVPDRRRVGDPTDEAYDVSGKGLIGELAKLQNPEHDEQELDAQFQRINAFLKWVTDNKTAEVRIPHSRKTINVSMDGRILPIQSLGAGISEVVILASAATIKQGVVMCVEEPELHLHPILQRKLLTYLATETENQYFFSTHSAHFMDSPDASVFHVRYGEASRVEKALTPASRARICHDLGYRPSDLLQTNSVIWVEGPSDRIYLNHWIRAVAPDLIEGTHYAIMFYGGRLLSHLTANDPEIDDFISLRRLNRFIAIVIDSDRSSARAPLNATKRRVRDEFDEGPGFAWITRGREIENYLQPGVIASAIQAVHPGAIATEAPDQFAKRLVYKSRSDGSDRIADKVKVAREVVAREGTGGGADLGVLDLGTRLRQLVAFVRAANDAASL